MAGQTTGCGCGALLLLLALVALLLPIVPSILGVLLAMGLLGLVATAVANVLDGRHRRRLRHIAANAEQRFVGDICHLDEGYGQLKGIGLAPADPARSGLRLCLRLHLLEPCEEPGAIPLQRREQQREVPVPAQRLEQLASTGEFGRFLRDQGIQMVNDLSVEARATQAAFQCLQEREWAEASQQRLTEMVRSVRTTLDKAAGNELLEPAIPQLQQALSSFQAEAVKLRRHRQESEAMLRKLHDFLSVPEQIRPILTFDLEGLFDPGRLQDLRASFDDVVTLNDSYRALSRERII